ncbi:CHASE3 domain-containing protein [Roseiarcus sp.]|uniref:CHASE3 domain-containing protein n=1 Tax=Roseiarcus sp. TaxID=1969460 RepID=UPI003F9D0336
MTIEFLARLRATIDEVKSDRRRRNGWISLTSSVLLLVVAAVLGTAMAIRVNNATAWVEHTYQVRGLADQIVIGLRDAESAVRDSALDEDGSGDPLEEYHGERRMLLENLAKLRRLVSDNPDQIHRLDQIDKLAVAFFNILDRAAASRRIDSASFASSLDGDTKALTKQFRELFSAVDAAEVDLLAQRQQTAGRLQAILFGLMLASLVCATIATIAVVATSWSFVRHVQAQAAALLSETESRRQAESLLLQTQKLELVGQLTAGIAHDFNNLLTIVLGNLDTVKRRIESGSAAELVRLARPVETASEGARRAASLTQKLLAFARQQPLAPRQLDLNRAVANMSDVLARTVGEAVKIETVLGAGLWPAFADSSQVDNAIVNLVVNARDSIPDGGYITIETANASLDEEYVAQFGDVAPGQYVMLSVSDTGVGIPKDVLPHVFEPFFTTKETGKGTGLGLAMIHGFVKQSKGHVRIYSELGQGTTVKIYLPRMTDAAPIASSPAEAPVNGEFPPARAGEVVLLVEDDEGVREFARGALEGLGYRVLAVGEGPEGLVHLRSPNRIDVLFTDVVLPGGINGRRLADEAAKLRPDLRVLFTTGYTRNAIVHDGRLDPDVRLITKPYTQEILARSLRRIIDEARPLT